MTTEILASVAGVLWLAQAVLHTRLARAGRPGGRGFWLAGLAVVILAVGLPLLFVGGGLLRLGQPIGAAVLAGAALLSAVQFVLLFGPKPPEGPAEGWGGLLTIYGAFWLGQTALFWLGLTPSWAIADAATLPRFWNDAALFAVALPVMPMIIAAGALYVRKQGS